MGKIVGIKGDLEWEITIDDIRFLPDESQKVYNHSPDGFSWGYLGSGVAQLALGLLLKYCGSKQFALKSYQRYKDEVISLLPDDFEMDEKEVKEWIARHLEKDYEI